MGGRRLSLSVSLSNGRCYPAVDRSFALGAILIMRATLILIPLVLIVGCTTIPATPVSPLTGQTRAQVDKDAAECAKASKPKGAPSYEACMIARQYRVSHHVLGSYGFGATPEIDLTMDTEAKKPRTPPQVEADVEACKAAVRARGSRTVMGYSSPDRVLVLAKRYSECMDQRGYRTSLWEAP